MACADPESFFLTGSNFDNLFLDDEGKEDESTL